MAQDDFNPSADSWMDEANPLAVDGGGGTLSLDSSASPNRKRAVAKFGLAGISSLRRIYSVELLLYFTAINQTGHLVVDALLRDWVEAEVCWTNWKAGSAWTTGGADSVNNDHETTLTSNVALTSTTVPQYHTFDLGASGIALVRNWVSGAWSNYGWRVREGNINRQWTIQSSEGANPPILRVNHFLLRGGQHGQINA